MRWTCGADAAVFAAVLAVALARSWLTAPLSPPPPPHRAWRPFDFHAVQHRVAPLARVHASALAALAPQYAALRVPFIVTGLCDGVGGGGRDGGATDPCGLASGAWTPDALGGGPFASAPAEWYPDGMPTMRPPPRRVRTPLADALRNASLPGGSGQQLVQWNLNASHWAALTAMLPPRLGLLTSGAAGAAAARPFALPPLLAFGGAWMDGALGGVVDSGGDDDGGAAPAHPPPSSRDPPAARLVSEFGQVTHWRMLLAGAHGGGMFNHVDALDTGSWQLQLAGAKRWSVCAPSQGDAVAAAASGAGAGAAPHVGQDLLRPTADEYRAPPGLATASCWLDVVGPGELIAYPPRHWHQTENLVGADAEAAVREASVAAAAVGGEAGGAPPADLPAGVLAALHAPLAVALTQSVVTPSHWRALAAQLAANCRKPFRPLVTPSRELCARTPAVVEAWRAQFGDAEAEAGGLGEG